MSENEAANTQQTEQASTGGSIMTSDQASVSAAPQETHEKTEIKEGAHSESESKATASWIDSLPDDIKADPSIKKFNDVESLAKSYIHAQKHIGSDRVIKPSEHATEEDWKKFYVDSGILPESLDNYSIKKPDGVELSDEQLSQFKQFAYENNLSPTQAEALIAYEANLIANGQEAMQKETEAKRQETLQGLKQEYGVALNPLLEAGKMVLNEYGSDGLLEKVDTKLGDDPDFIRFVMNLGKAMKEPEIKAGTREVGALSPSEAQQKANDIISNPSHPYHLREHPNHEAAMKEMQKLYSFIYPNSE